MDACEQRVAAEPAGYESALCFYLAAAATGDWSGAQRRLAALEADHPDNVWLSLAAAHVTWQGGEVSDARRRYRHVAARFQQSGEHLGELIARQNLRNLLYHAGEIDDADAEVHRVVAIGRQSEDPAIVVRANVTEANHLMNTGRQIGRAYRVLHGARQVAEASSDYALMSQVVGGLGNASLLLGEFGEAVHHFASLVDLAMGAGDEVGRALALFNAANATVEGLIEMPDPERLDDVVALAEQALAAAMAAEAQHVQIYAHRLLGELYAATQPTLAVKHLDRCATLAEDAGYVSECSLYRAWVAARHDPERGLGRLESALEELAALGDDPRLPYGWHLMMRAAWQLGPPERALSTGFRALDAIESLRRLQDDAAGRTGFLSAWTRDYYWLSGRLLEHGDSGRAFEVLERMRARELREQLEIFRAEAGEVRRGDLERVELARVQERLAPNEALLSFQLGNWEDIHGDFAGGAWLIAATRASTHVQRLPGRVALSRSVPLFSDLVRRGELPPAASTVLYERLLKPVLDALPETIERLILLPDGVLHQVPFSALRQAPEELPLGEQYQIELVPSGALFQRWRSDRRPGGQGRALVVAAPDLPRSLMERNGRTVANPGSPRSGAEFGALPFARLEGRAVHAAFGGGGTILSGVAASEAAVKAADLTEFDVVHFASHTLVDPRDPDRSAILLSPGGQREDGLLHTHEIAGLTLAGAVVVLSSCESASGPVVRGEGIMGLARAFFQAGARTVIGTLWSVRDDHARDFFGYFYHHAARGATVAQALTGARADARASGLPADVWAGFVLLGDGHRTIMRGTGGNEVLAGSVAIAGGVVLVLALGFTVWRTWARKRR